MSFQFGFSEEILSDNGDSNQSMGNHGHSAPEGQNLKPSPLDSEFLKSPEVKQPVVIELQQLLQTIRGIRVSYEKFKSPECQTQLYRRELFDVKHQLMTEDTKTEIGSAATTDEFQILLGETNEDLRKYVYEGGLKSWECSLDLADVLSLQNWRDRFPDCVVEMGCGSALPSEYLFLQVLQRNVPGTKFVLTDYNEFALRLVTLPNFVIGWAATVLNDVERVELQRCDDDTIPIVEGELLFTDVLLEAFVKDISSRGIELTFISGAWGRVFYEMLESLTVRSTNLLLLTSETIYNPETLPVIGEIILELTSKIKQDPRQVITTMVAAKDIYFGVGGSVIEFQRYMENRIREESVKITLSTLKVNSGLKRSIVVFD
ncbi:LAMI_0E04522g1_1 [Lachancea mirantina]|uniref:protein-histidine N-methyltransferase n=1 Tax=Lachancea mirantina TaxID=1230905 RepID=A0A1G4JKE7_9SACH|nr:LAMI_0E04522g1_1 [Lachancea mirantina]